MCGACGMLSDSSFATGGYLVDPAVCPRHLRYQLVGYSRTRCSFHCVPQLFVRVKGVKSTNCISRLQRLT